MNIITTIRDSLIPSKQKTTPWDTAIRWVLIGIVFLAPTFFLPHHTYTIEFNKVILFNTLVLIIAIVYVLKILLRREATVTIGPLHWAILVFVIMQMVSFIFSGQHYVSAVGISGWYDSGIVSIVCFALFAFLLTQTIRSTKDVIIFLVTLLISGVVAVAYNFFQVFGVYLLPWEVTKNIGFNAVAPAAEGFAVFVGICLLISFVFSLLAKKKWQRILAGGGTVLALGLLFILDQKVAMYALTIGFFVLLLCVAVRAKYFSNPWIILSTVALTLVVLFVFVDSSSLTKIDIQKSAVLDFGTSATVAWKTFAHAPLWGSGQQTFAFDFEEYRTVDFNNSDIWNLRFIKGSNEWLTLAATTGLGGICLFLLISIWFLVHALRQLFGAKKPDTAWKVGSLLLVVWVVLFVVGLLMPHNFIINFLWWFVLALGLVMIPHSLKPSTTYSLAVSPARSVMSGVVFVIITVGTLLILFFGGKVWLADYYFARAQEGIAAKADITTVQNNLIRAAEMAPRESFYHVSVAQGYATQAQLEALKAQPDMAVIQQFTQKAINSLKVAKEIDPHNPFVYEQEAAVYDGMRALVSNADALSAAAYAKAIILEPTNPLAYVNLGRAQLLTAQAQLNALADGGDKTAINQLIDQAANNFKKAESLKNNFVPAQYALALSLQLKGETDAAIGSMEKLALNYPTDTDVLSSLASLYTQKGSYDKAVAIYQQLIKLLPDDSTIHWQLALVYEKQDKKAEALAELDIVIKANPGNTTVQQKIDKLNNPQKTEE